MLSFNKLSLSHITVAFINWSITSLNKGLCNFTGEVLFTSRDYELNSTVANRVIEINDDGTITDKSIPYEEYIDKKSN